MISHLMNKKQNLQALVMKQTSFGSLDVDGDKKYVDNTVEEIQIKLEPDDFPIIKDQNSNQNNTIDMSLIEIKEEDDEVKPEISTQNVTIKKEKAPLTKYNPLARNPLYGGGEFSAYIELIDLKNHFHPTVALYASNIISDQMIKYSGDPLNDFTLIRFLDRFVFKNPKKVEEKDGIHPTLAKRKLYKPKGIKLVPVFSEGYVKEKPENIPVDELFLHS